MCGIFGIISSNLDVLGAKGMEFATRDMMRLAESRGKEASGLALALGDKIQVLKRPFSGSQLLKTEEFESLFESLGNSSGPVALIGHSRMVTNGGREQHENNQPVIADGIVGIHNGIVVNDGLLFDSIPGLKRDLAVDTEVILDLIQHYRAEGMHLIQATRQAFAKIEGVATVALLFNDLDMMLLATNNGSLYYSSHPESGTLLFASERVMLERFFESGRLGVLREAVIQHLAAGEAILVNRRTLALSRFPLAASVREGAHPAEAKSNAEITDLREVKPSKRVLPVRVADGDRRLLEYDEDKLKRQRRCTKCLLPYQFPYIAFDVAGVCNYCHAYQPVVYRGAEAFREEFQGLKSEAGGRPDCIVALSGGRDSCYALHYMKRELGLQPVAYTYDWGMITDLARRNISRMCAKLGVEHILVSADITRKRENIRKNVTAWLKRPHLGMVPLFMAGDKQFFYYANKTKNETGAKKIVFGMNGLEKTDFKTGLTGIPHAGPDTHYRLGVAHQLRLLSFYTKQLLLNPSLINTSLLDSAFAFYSYYVIPHDYLLFFRYLRWNEAQIVETLRAEYDWEISPDTTTTWRIGDGTTPLYNYIYVTALGYSESDTFRSNQIREGLITREQGLSSILEENRPRYESIRWYCETVGLDFQSTIERINGIPKPLDSSH